MHIIRVYLHPKAGGGQIAEFKGWNAEQQLRTAFGDDCDSDSNLLILR